MSHKNLMKWKNFWNELVDQVAFVDYCPWEDVYSSKNKVQTPCSELWRRMYISDGLANPQEVDANLFYNLVRLKIGISSLWTSKIYKDLRTKHTSKSRGDLDPCNKCVVV